MSEKKFPWGWLTLAVVSFDAFLYGCRLGGSPEDATFVWEWRPHAIAGIVVITAFLVSAACFIRRVRQ